MKTMTFEELDDKWITPCCGYSVDDVVLEHQCWLETGVEISICTCGRVVKVDYVLGLCTVMERE